MADETLPPQEPVAAPPGEAPPSPEAPAPEAQAGDLLSPVEAEAPPPEAPPADPISEPPPAEPAAPAPESPPAEGGAEPSPAALGTTEGVAASDPSAAQADPPPAMDPVPPASAPDDRLAELTSPGMIEAGVLQPSYIQVRVIRSGVADARGYLLGVGSTPLMAPADARDLAALGFVEIL